MTAETLTGSRAAAAVQPVSHSLSGVMHVAYGVYSIASTALEDGDIFHMCKLPRNSLVVGGTMHIADLDTGTESVDIDCGWADNGGSTATYTGADGVTYTNMYDGSAAAAGFVNSGVLTGDAITDLLATGNNMRPFPMTYGPIYFSEETTVSLEVNAAQATGQAGIAYVKVEYIVLG
jgi:hypothetical protein